MVEIHSTSLTLGDLFLTHVEMAVIAASYRPHAVRIGGCDGHFYAHRARHGVRIAHVPVAVHPVLSRCPLDSIARCVHTA